MQSQSINFTPLWLRENLLNLPGLQSCLVNKNSPLEQKYTKTHGIHIISNQKQMTAFNKKTRILLFGAFSCMLVKTLAGKKEKEKEEVIIHFMINIPIKLIQDK